MENEFNVLEVWGGVSQDKRKIYKQFIRKGVKFLSDVI